VSDERSAFRNVEIQVPIVEIVLLNGALFVLEEQAAHPIE
jgi:hypothetical protein